jgi:hypothetical protein
MAEYMNTAPTGGSNYRCTRGCGATLGGPADQDAHNAQAHGNSGWSRLGDDDPKPDPNSQPGDFTNINSRPKRIWGMRTVMGGSN